MHPVAVQSTDQVPGNTIFQHTSTLTLPSMQLKLTEFQSRILFSAMADDLKDSAVVWGGKPSDAPPAYNTSDPEPHNDDPQPSPQPAPPARRPVPRTPYDPLRRLAPLASINWQKYDILDGSLSTDRVNVTVQHSDLYAHPQHLLPFILEQAYLPPKPTLRIVGVNMHSDFDITLNLTHLLDLRNFAWKLNSAQVSPMHGGSGVLYHRDESSVPGRIASLVKQFCQDTSENKSFSLRRRVEGLPTETLAGQVRNLAASVKYRGDLRIEFTDEYSNVLVHKQPSNWFSNMFRLHAEKKYEMVETVWHVWDGSVEVDGGEVDRADMGLRAAHEWWQTWSPAIRNAMIGKRKGTVGVDDWMAAKMGRGEQEPYAPWGETRMSS